MKGYIQFEMNARRGEKARKLSDAQNPAGARVNPHRHEKIEYRPPQRFLLLFCSTL